MKNEKEIELITLPKELFVSHINFMNDPRKWQVIPIAEEMINLQENANELKEVKKDEG